MGRHTHLVIRTLMRQVIQKDVRPLSEHNLSSRKPSLNISLQIGYAQFERACGQVRMVWHDAWLFSAVLGTKIEKANRPQTDRTYFSLIKSHLHGYFSGFLNCFMRMYRTYALLRNSNGISKQNLLKTEIKF